MHKPPIVPTVVAVAALERAKFRRTCNAPREGTVAGRVGVVDELLGDCRENIV